MCRCKDAPPGGAGVGGCVHCFCHLVSHADCAVLLATRVSRSSAEGYTYRSSREGGGGSVTVFFFMLFCLVVLECHGFLHKCERLSRATPKRCPRCKPCVLICLCRATYGSASPASVRPKHRGWHAPHAPARGEREREREPYNRHY